MKKRIIALLITLSTLLSLFPATTFANSGVKVAIDSKTIEFDVEPQIINGRTMVPMRKIFRELGATVEWDGKTKTVTGKKDDTTVILQIGKDSISVNGKNSSLDAAPCIVNNTTLVPARAIAESFGVGVIWYGDIKTVAIYNDGYTIETERIYDLKGHGTSVDKNFVKNYLDLGWAYDIEDIEKVTVYAPDGKSKEVYIGDVPDEVAVGWYTEPVTTMYAPDGRTQIVPTTQVEANKNVGWYTEPLVTMYALDGRTQVVPKSQVEANEKVGWYTEPLQTLYSPDGRTIVVKKSEVASYKKIGWYEDSACTPEIDYSILKNYLSTGEELLRLLVTNYNKGLYSNCKSNLSTLSATVNSAYDLCANADDPSLSDVKDQLLLVKVHCAVGLGEDSLSSMSFFLHLSTIKSAYEELMLTAKSSGL